MTLCNLQSLSKTQYPHLGKRENTFLKMESISHCVWHILGNKYHQMGPENEWQGQDRAQASELHTLALLLSFRWQPGAAGALSPGREGSCRLSLLGTCQAQPPSLRIQVTKATSL